MAMMAVVVCAASRLHIFMFSHLSHSPIPMLVSMARTVMEIWDTTNPMSYLAACLNIEFFFQAELNSESHSQTSRSRLLTSRWTSTALWPSPNPLCELIGCQSNTLTYMLLQTCSIACLAYPITVSTALSMQAARKRRSFGDTRSLPSSPQDLVFGRTV